MDESVFPTGVPANTPELSPSASPCVRNCCLDDDNICLGCGRRLAEILEWHRADEVRREEIRGAAQRRQRLGRGGDSRRQPRTQ